MFCGIGIIVHYHTQHHKVRIFQTVFLEITLTYLEWSRDMEKIFFIFPLYVVKDTIRRVHYTEAEASAKLSINIFTFLLSHVSSIVDLSFLWWNRIRMKLKFVSLGIKISSSFQFNVLFGCQLRWKLESSKQFTLLFSLCYQTCIIVLEQSLQIMKSNAILLPFRVAITIIWTKLIFVNPM